MLTLHISTTKGVRQIPSVEKLPVDTLPCLYVLCDAHRVLDPAGIFTGYSVEALVKTAQMLRTACPHLPKLYIFPSSPALEKRCVESDGLTSAAIPYVVNEAGYADEASPSDRDV